MLEYFSKSIYKVCYGNGANMKHPAERLSEINRLAVLRSISGRQTFTKMDVVREAHLSLPTVNGILAALETECYVVPNGNGESRGGRPPALYRFNPVARYAIGIKVDSPTIAIGLVDLQANLHRVVEYPFDDDSTSEYIEATLTQGILDILAEQKIEPAKMIGLGIGVPGYFERDTGTGLDTCLCVPSSKYLCAIFSQKNLACPYTCNTLLTSTHLPKCKNHRCGCATMCSSSRVRKASRRVLW